MADALRRALAERDDDGVTAKDRVAQEAIKLATAGDLDALKFIFERMDGKVPDPPQVQQQESTGTHTIRVVYDRAPGPDWRERDPGAPAGPAPESDAGDS